MSACRLTSRKLKKTTIAAVSAAFLISWFFAQPIDENMHKGQIMLDGIMTSRSKHGAWFWLQCITGQVFVDLRPATFIIPERIGKRAQVFGVYEGDSFYATQVDLGF